jgi:hypothetical protein
MWRKFLCNLSNSKSWVSEKNVAFLAPKETAWILYQKPVSELYEAARKIPDTDPNIIS